MEKGEESVQVTYEKIAKYIPEVKRIVKEENDALVELIGALVGLTLALQNTRLITMTGLITGTAASFSIVASEYLSTKTEESDQELRKASILDF